MSSEGCIKRMLKTHRWDNKEFPDGPKPCEHGEMEGHLLSPTPVDCLTQVCKEEGFKKEGTVEHSILEKKMGFQHCVVPGELMHAMATATPDMAHSVTTPSKFSSAPSECHHQLLKGLTKHLQITKSRGIKFFRPEDNFLNDLPSSNCQEPVPLPEVVGELIVDISQPKLIGFADAGCGSELAKQRSITGCAFTFSGGATACKSETQTITESSSAKAEFIAAFTAAKAA